MTKKYCLETMAATEINAVIYSEVMHGSRRPCTGPVTVSIAVRTEMPGKAQWSCATCGAQGECSVEQGISLKPEHARVAPDYFMDHDLAIQVLRKINAEWPRPQRFWLDFYLFGIERRKAGEFIARKPLVDLMLNGFESMKICYAVIHALNEMASKEEEKDHVF